MLWLLGLYVVNSFTTLAIALRSARRPAESLTWVLVCTVLPVVGALLYAAVGRPIPVSRRKFEIGGEEDARAASFADKGVCALPAAKVIEHAIGKESGFAAARAEVSVLDDGQDAFAALLAAIESAEHSIDLEYYIFLDDAIGQQFCDAVERKAEQGVRVRLLVDGFGSRKFARTRLLQLVARGVEGRVFFPIEFPWFTSTLNYRDHCKIAVIDRITAFTGGINIGLEYTGLKADVGPWRDTHLCVAGDAAAQLQAVFEMNWELGTPIQARQDGTVSAGDGATTSRRQPRIVAATPPQLQMETASELHPTTSGLRPAQNVKLNLPMKAWVQTVESGPDRPVRATQVLYFLYLTQAAQTVDIATPYFAPDIDLTMAIKTAVARGVRVRLLLPAYSDHPLIGVAGRSYYTELLQAGVEIYLYETALLHAKVLIVDGAISVLGAANIDLRSFRLNYEVCTALYSDEAAQELTRQFERDLTHAKRITATDVRGDNLLQHLGERAARLLAPLL